MKTHPRAHDTPAMRAALANPQYRDPSLFAPDVDADFELDEKEFIDRKQAAELRRLTAIEERGIIEDQSSSEEEDDGAEE